MSNTMAAMENHRHARERGGIIRVLNEAYSAEMTSVSDLFSVMDMLGIPISPDAMRHHLNYLCQQGFIQCWRSRDMPGWRKDRPMGGAGDEFRFAKLLPKGLHLLDGHIAEDPMVTF